MVTILICILVALLFIIISIAILHNLDKREEVEHIDTDEMIIKDMQSLMYKGDALNLSNEEKSAIASTYYKTLDYQYCKSILDKKKSLTNMNNDDEWLYNHEPHYGFDVSYDYIRKLGFIWKPPE
jgi:hypothetical protein